MEKATEPERERQTTRECLGGRGMEKKMFTSAHPCTAHMSMFQALGDVLKAAMMNASFLSHHS